MDVSKSSICAATWQNQQNWHVRIAKTLIRLGGWILSYALSAQRRFCSDWAGAQAGPSLRLAHRSLCWFCHEAALLFLEKARTLRCPPQLPRSKNLREFGGHCYEFILGEDKRKTWHDAELDCNRAGGHLVTIRSMPEQTFIYQSLEVRILFYFG